MCCGPEQSRLIQPAPYNSLPQRWGGACRRGGGSNPPYHRGDGAVGGVGDTTVLGRDSRRGAGGTEMSVAARTKYLPTIYNCIAMYLNLCWYCCTVLSWGAHLYT